MNAELKILVIIFNNGNAAVRIYIPSTKKALEFYLQLKYLADEFKRTEETDLQPYVFSLTKTVRSQH